MERRAFLAGSLGVLVAPPVVEAQSAGKVHRIGVLGNVPLSDAEGARLWGAFVDGLRDLGYLEGRNITFEWRFSDGKYEQLPDFAVDLVRLKVDVIIVPAAQNAFAAKQATRTIPIVMTSIGDPVATGLIASLARPGGNVTGLSNMFPQIGGKQLELLKEIVPRDPRVGILWNPSNSSHLVWLREAKVAAHSLAVQLQTSAAREPEEFETALAVMTRERASAILVLADGMFIQHRARIVDLVAKRRVPAMYGTRELVDAGGLMFYGPSLRDGFRRAAIYVDKILKGAKPADLPVEQPSKFELVINMKTAKALGLTIPPAVLARADELIQ